MSRAVRLARVLWLVSAVVLVVGVGGVAVLGAVASDRFGVGVGAALVVVCGAVLSGVAARALVGLGWLDHRLVTVPEPAPALCVTARCAVALQLDAEGRAGGAAPVVPVMPVGDFTSTGLTGAGVTVYRSRELVCRREHSPTVAFPGPYPVSYWRSGNGVLTTSHADDGSLCSVVVRWPR